MILQCRAARCTERPSSRVAPTAQPIISIPGHYPRSETYAVFNCEWSSSFSSSSPPPSPLFFLLFLLLLISASSPTPLILASLLIFAFTREAFHLVREHRSIQLFRRALERGTKKRQTWSVESGRLMICRRRYRRRIVIRSRVRVNGDPFVDYIRVTRTHRVICIYTTRLRCPFLQHRSFNGTSVILIHG